VNKPAKIYTGGAEVSVADKLAEAQAERLEKKEDQKMASRIPKPTGYKLLIGLPEVSEMTDGGIIKAAQTINDDSIGSVVGYVMAMGPDAYADKTRFPSGPYCKVGDWVIMRTYSGTRFLVDDKELRLINDESVESTVEDPRAIKRR